MGPKDLARALRAMGPYRRSHHPLCGPFRADVFVVKGRRYCIACFVGYPVLVLTALAGVALFGSVRAATGAVWWAWVVAGLVAALPQALSFAGRVPDWRAQVAVKVALGLGFGLVVAGLLSAPWPLAARLAALVAALVALNALWLLRFHRLERTCQACPQVGLRPRCEGLAELDDRVGHLLRLPRGGWQRVD